MKKCFVFLLIAMTLLALVAQAQDLRSVSGGTARNISLGGGPINPYLVDVTRIHTNPALLGKYADYVWGDIGYVNQDAGESDANFGGGRYQYIATSFGLNDQWALGLIVNKREGPMFNTSFDPRQDPVDVMTLSYSPTPLSHPLSPVELAVSCAASSVFDLGLSVTIAGWSARNDNGTSVREVSTRVTGFKLGGNYDLGSGSSLDGAILFRFNTATYTNSAALANPSQVDIGNGLEFAADLRYIHRVNSKWNFVPIGRYSTFSWGPQFTPIPASPSANPPFNYSHTEYELGAGVQYHTEKVLVVGGFSAQSISSTTEDKRTATVVKTTNSEWDFPKINMGVEFSITDWMVARAGYFKRLSSSESKIEDTTLVADVKTSAELPYSGDPNFLSAGQQAFTLGVGFHFSGFSIDGTIGEGYFINGPWPLSGIGQSVFGMLSLHYLW